MDFPSGINVFVDGVHHNRYVQYVNTPKNMLLKANKHDHQKWYLLSVTCMHYDVIIMQTVDTKILVRCTFAMTLIDRFVLWA